MAVWKHSRPEFDDDEIPSYSLRNGMSISPYVNEDGTISYEVNKLLYRFSDRQHRVHKGRDAREALNHR